MKKQAEPLQTLYLSGSSETGSCVPIRCTKRHAVLLRVSCEFDSRRGCQANTAVNCFVQFAAVFCYEKNHRLLQFMVLSRAVVLTLFLFFPGSQQIIHSVQYSLPAVRQHTHNRIFV